MVNARLNKNSILSGILMLAALWIVFRVIPPFVPSNLKVSVFKDRGDVRAIHQERDIVQTKTLVFDKVDLQERNRLAHPVLGDFAYIENFFMDIEAVMRVHAPGEYRFMIGSDDGFAFYIDGDLICQFANGRALGYTRCKVELTAGEHDMKLSYYQGFGNSGLRATYSPPENKGTYLVGEDSRYIDFSPP